MMNIFYSLVIPYSNLPIYSLSINCPNQMLYVLLKLIIYQWSCKPYWGLIELLFPLNFLLSSIVVSTNYCCTWYTWSSFFYYILLASLAFCCNLIYKIYRNSRNWVLSVTLNPHSSPYQLRLIHENGVEIAYLFHLLFK